MSAKPFYIHAECTVEETLTEDDIFDILEHLNKVGASIAATPGETRLNLSLTIEARTPARAAETATALISMATTETGLGDVTITAMEIRDEPTFNKWMDDMDKINIRAMHWETCERKNPHLQPENALRLIGLDPATVITNHLDTVAMALCADLYTDIMGAPVDDPAALWAGIVGMEREGFLKDANVAMAAFFPLLERDMRRAAFKNG